MKGYCMKCKKVHEMEDFKTVTINGRKFAKGLCKKHGTKMSKLV